MKVSSVELKTRLGHYLRTIEQSGEPLEVCIRGRAVATLLPHGSTEARIDSGNSETFAMNRALEHTGMRVERASHTGPPPDRRPLTAGDGRKDINTIEATRNAREW